MIGAVGTLLVAIVGVVTWWQQSHRPSDIVIESITADPKLQYIGQCPVTMNYAGAITARSGQGAVTWQALTDRVYPERKTKFGNQPRQRISEQLRFDQST